MKKLTLKVSFFMLVVLLGLVIINIYIQPNEHLDLEAKDIDVTEKIKYMVVNLKTEVVLTEDEIDSIIKKRLDPNIGEHLLIEGARFYIENNHVYAKLNVKYRERIKTELNVSFTYELNTDGTLILNPVNIKLKDISLPVNLIEQMKFELYDMENSIVKITGIENKARQLIIKWKIDLY